MQYVCLKIFEILHLQKKTTCTFKKKTVTTISWPACGVIICDYLTEDIDINKKFHFVSELSMF